MQPASRIDSFAPYAALALLIAGLFWFAVASVAGKRAKRPGGGDVFSVLAAASAVTGVAFVLIFVAWLSR